MFGELAESERDKKKSERGRAKEITRIQQDQEDETFPRRLQLPLQFVIVKRKLLDKEERTSVLTEYSELGNIWFETPFILNFYFAKVCVIILHSIQNGNTLGLCFCFKEKVEIFSYPSLSR